jgi:MoaA/NifB/PqqE/SkfB family radical SAM enzyme
MQEEINKLIEDGFLDEYNYLDIVTMYKIEGLITQLNCDTCALNSASKEVYNTLVKEIGANIVEYVELMLDEKHISEWDRDDSEREHPE